MRNKIGNYIKSIPTRVAAKKEYNRGHFEMKRMMGSQPVKVRRENPVTYNKASTGIRGKNKR